MLVTPPCGASSNIALWRAKIKPPVELVVGDLVVNEDKSGKELKNEQTSHDTGSRWIPHAGRI